MSNPKDDLNTTTILEDLFNRLRQYSNSQQVSETDLLRERARHYAAADAPHGEPGGDALTALAFNLGGARYCVDVMAVRGVRPLPPVTRVPGAPPFYRGVMNVRGTVMTQLDLLAFFGMGQTHDAAELIVLARGALVLGVPVARVAGVVAIPYAQVRSLEDTHYAVGVYNQSDGNTIVLDVDEIFNDRRLISGDES